MTDRLAEIEKQTAMDKRWLTNTQEGPGAVACISRALLDKAVEQRDWLVARVREQAKQLDIVTEMLEVALEVYPDLHNAPAMLAAFDGKKGEE